MCFTLYCSSLLLDHKDDNKFLKPYLMRLYYEANRNKKQAKMKANIYLKKRGENSGFARTHKNNCNDKNLENEWQRTQADGRTVLSKYIKAITKWWQVLHHWGHAKQSLPVFMERKRSTAKGRDKNKKKAQREQTRMKQNTKWTDNFRRSGGTRRDLLLRTTPYFSASLWAFVGCALLPTRQVSGGNDARACKHSLPLLVLLSDSCQIMRAAEFNGNATLSCGKNSHLTATPIQWIGFQNYQKRNTHRARELACWITDARSPPAWPPRDSRGWDEQEPRVTEML